jgi:hypothetical protein
MTTLKEKEQPIEELIGNMIGKIFCLFLFAFKRTSLRPRGMSAYDPKRKSSPR